MLQNNKSRLIVFITSLFILVLAGRNAESQLFYSTSEYNKLKNEKLALKFELDDLYKKKFNLEKKLKNLTEQYNNDKLNLDREISALKTSINDLEKKLEKLKREKDEEKSLCSNRISSLQSTIDLLKRKGSDREKELLAINRKQREKCEGDLKKLKSILESERNKNIADINRLRKKYEKEIAGLRERIANLNQELTEFKRLTESQQRELERMSDQTRELEKQLSEEIKLGQIRLKKFHDKLIINIDDKISFNSGSARLKPAVLKALKKISDILTKYPENRIVVEGHTDNVPIVSKIGFRDNWHLSAERALAVLGYILKKNPELDRSRFSAAGYGEYHPIVPNNSKANKALNRRVDIVVIPRINHK